MEERDLGAVAEGFGYERRRALEDQLADGTVAGAEEVDPEIAEAIHDGVGVEMAPGEGAGEEPWAVGPSARTKIRTSGEVLPDS